MNLIKENITVKSLLRSEFSFHGVHRKFERWIRDKKEIKFCPSEFPVMTA